MLILTLFWAGLALALGYSTDCQTTFHGECHSIYTGCPSGFSYYTYSGCSFRSQCCYNIGTSGHTTPKTTPLPSGQASCGTRDYTENHRIVGGEWADTKEFPWQVSLRYYNYHMCGGTLIDNQHVLTAQHCFENTHDRYWSVALGVNNINAIPRSHVYSISRVFHNTNFNNLTHTNDIAIVRLSKPVDLSGSYARAACLPDQGENFDNRLCTVTGWGDTHQGASGVDYLRKVDIPILPNTQCEYYLSHVGGRGVVTEKQICAGLVQGGKDACQGDSGGPLVCFDDARQTWKIVGVVSWGYGCAQRYKPGVYTRVSEYLDFVSTAVGSSGMIG